MTVVSSHMSAKSRDGFSGRWVHDKSKGASADVAPDDLIQNIKQKGNNLVIQSTFKEPKNGVAPILLVGILITELRLTTDGKENFTMVGPFEHRSKTKVAGNRLITDWTATVKGDTVTGNWTRTLSDDDKVLTLEIKQSSAKGETKAATLIFNKK